jgi:hypothetical protein
MPVTVARALLSRSPFLGLPLGIALIAAACSIDAGDNGGGSGGASGGQVTGTAGSGTSVLPNGGSGIQPGGGNGPVAGATSMAGSAPAGGSAPVGGSAPGGSADTGGGNSTTSDTPPVRPLKVDPNSAANKSIGFTAKQLDPMAGTSMTDTNAGAQEHGQVDTRKPKMQGKLVLTLGGIGTCCGQGGIGGFAVGLGFHEMGLAMQTKISSAPDMYKNVIKATPDDPEANRQMGDARMEAFDGKDRVSWLDINPHDALEMRTQLALQYMQSQDPGGDWEYFLNADGSVRWSDVYFVGYSYGSQTLAVIAKYVRIGRGIATSGPVDEGFPNATWIKQASATPLERMIGLFGSENLDTKVMTTTAAGWLGPPVTVNAGATTADLMSGHLFILQGQGHSEFCAGDGGNWKALCQYSFGVMQ